MSIELGESLIQLRRDIKFSRTEIINNNNKIKDKDPLKKIRFMIRNLAYKFLC